MDNISLINIDDTVIMIGCSRVSGERILVQVLWVDNYQPAVLSKSGIGAFRLPSQLVGQKNPILSFNVELDYEQEKASL